MPTILITGANRGLGLAFAHSYAAQGWHVVATCRAPDGADDLRALRDAHKDKITLERLDMQDWAGIDHLAQALADRPIDLLLLNAGQFGPRDQSISGFSDHEWMQVLRTNLMGPYKTAIAFAPHVARSSYKKIIAISSLMGSIQDNKAGGYYVYRSSKAALNAVMKSMALDLAPRGVTVAILHPGWVKTDMGGSSAPLEITDSVSAMQKTIAALTQDKTGGFFNYDGKVLPW